MLAYKRFTQSGVKGSSALEYEWICLDAARSADGAGPYPAEVVGEVICEGFLPPTTPGLSEAERLSWYRHGRNHASHPPKRPG